MTDALVEKVAKLLVSPKWDVWHEHAVPLAKQIHQLYLADPSICKVEVGAELPVWKMAKERDELGNTVYRLAQQDMIDDGWVKEKKEGVRG